MFRFCSQFDCRYHIAVSRYNNLQITIVLTSISYYLQRNSNICSFLLIGMNNIMFK